jgi:choline kinase
LVDNLQGAILAAGRGERLRKAVGDLPKPLVVLDGETMLGRQARLMLEMDVAPVVAVINNETARTVRERRIDLPAGLKLCVRDTANSMESLFTLGENLGAGRFLLATVDAVIHPKEAQRFIARALEMTAPWGSAGAEGALGVVRWRGDRRPLFVEVGRDGFITALGEGEAPLVTAGIYLFSTRIFEFRDEARRVGLDAMRYFLAMLVRRGMRFGAVELAAAIDIDEPGDLEEAAAMLRADR